MVMLILQAAGLFDSFGGGGAGSAIQVFQTILMGIFVLIIGLSVAGFVVFRMMDKKKYNINVQIIVPRSDGRIVEWHNAVGSFGKSKKVGGITSFTIKRKGLGKVEIPPPRSDFIVAPNNTLLLAQKGIDDYEPIMPNNLSMVKTSMGKDKEGRQLFKQVPILNLHAINQDATAWGFDMEETAKRRFTFSSMWDKYKEMITLTLIVFVFFIGLYINWIGQKDVVDGLADVARILKGTTAPIITPGG